MSKAPKAFDTKASERVDRIYQNADIVRQRRFMLDHLALQPGDHVFDIGCGPGLLAMDMASIVGADGRIIAMDPSAEMRALAEKRCADTPIISIVDGDAIDLPCDDSSMDVAIATQVYEYVPDMEKALHEARRILKPGGRLAIIDTDWDSAFTRTSDRQRMRAVLQLQRDHFVHPDLPGKLPSLITRGGFELSHTGGMPIINTSLAPENFCTEVLYALAKKARKHETVGEDAADAWLQELKALDAAGEFFFSVTRFFFVATKPD